MTNAWLVDLVHPAHEQISCNIVLWERECGLGLFQDSDHTGDDQDSKSTSNGVLCIQESNVRTSKLDVQAAIFRLTRHPTTSGHLVKRWIANGRCSCFGSVCAFWSLRGYILHQEVTSHDETLCVKRARAEQR